MCTLLVHTHKYSQMIHPVCVMCRALIWSVKTTQTIHDISKFGIRSLRICALDTSARVPTVHSSCIQGSTLGFNGSQWIHWAPRAAKNCGLEPRIFRQDFMFCFFKFKVIHMTKPKKYTVISSGWFLQVVFNIYSIHCSMKPEFLQQRSARWSPPVGRWVPFFRRAKFFRISNLFFSCC